MLKSKYSDPSRDPLAAKSLDEGQISEWLVGPTDGEDDDDDEVFPGEGLTWAQIGEIVDTDAGARRTVRPASRITEKVKGKRLMEEESSEEDIPDTSVSHDPDDYATDQES